MKGGKQGGTKRQRCRSWRTMMCLSNKQRQKYKTDEVIKMVHTQGVKARLDDFTHVPPSSIKIHPHTHTHVRI